MAEYHEIVQQVEAAQAALKAELMACLGGKHERQTRFSNAAAGRVCRLAG